MENTERAIKKRNDRYGAYIKAITPETSLVKSLAKSFLIGGLTCVIAQVFFEIYSIAFPNLTDASITGYTLCTIIVIAVFLTGIGVFDKIGRFAGAGAFLPITGFANAMASASMEFRTEGLIFGSQTKFFSVVGPVLVNGIVWSTLAGVIHGIIYAATG